MHQRPYDVIQRKTLKVVDDTDEDTETAESLAFKNAFGYKPRAKQKAAGAKTYTGDLEVQERILDGVIKEHPELGTGGGEGTWTTKSKASLVKLTAYVETRGTTKSKDEVSARSLQDFGLFKNECKSKRADWDDDRVKLEWTLVEKNADKNSMKYGGDPDHFGGLQLPIPSWIFGSMTLEDRTSNYEGKQAESSTKPQTMDKDKIQQLQSDCQTGFDMIKQAGADDTLKPASYNSLTKEGNIEEKIAETYDLTLKAITEEALWIT
jgi:hypothetical protein